MLGVTINAKSLSNSIDCDQPTTGLMLALNESAHTHIPFGLNS